VFVNDVLVSKFSLPVSVYCDSHEFRSYFSIKCCIDKKYNYCSASGYYFQKTIQKNTNETEFLKNLLYAKVTGTVIYVINFQRE